jgi:hypothetical protein
LSGLGAFGKQLSSWLPGDVHPALLVIPEAVITEQGIGLANERLQQILVSPEAVAASRLLDEDAEERVAPIANGAALGLGRRHPPSHGPCGAGVNFADRQRSAPAVADGCQGSLEICPRCSGQDCQHWLGRREWLISMAQTPDAAVDQADANDLISFLKSMRWAWISSVGCRTPPLSTCTATRKPDGYNKAHLQSFGDEFQAWMISQIDVTLLSVQGAPSTVVCSPRRASSAITMA